MADTPPPEAPPPPVEGATKQFTLKMSSWLTAMASDLAAPEGTPTPPAEASLDQLLQPDDAKPLVNPLPDDDPSFLDSAFLASEPPPKP